MRALAAATRYGQWRAKDHGTPVAPAGINRRIAEDVVHTVLSVDPKGRRLDHDEAAALLAAYGIEVWAKQEALRPTRPSRPPSGWATRWS